MTKQSQLIGSVPVLMKRPNWIETSVVRRGRMRGKKREAAGKNQRTTHPLVTVGKLPGAHNTFRNPHKLFNFYFFQNQKKKNEHIIMNPA